MEYRFHTAPSRETLAAKPASPHVTLEAETLRHGAALALLDFVRMGCEVDAPLAHVDVTDAAGTVKTLLVEEILDWLTQPAQRDFVEREGLEFLIGKEAS